MKIRTYTIFLSCPGDLSEAKDALESVTRELAPHFLTIGIDLKVWRYESHVPPGVHLDRTAQSIIDNMTPDYDLYVGIMYRRFGRPTGRAPSGTVDEFDQACRRYFNSGRPDILFYFCSNCPPAENPEDEDQRKRVIAFRNEYPGLFAMYQDEADLLSKFKSHLVDYVLRFSTNRPPPPFAWAAELGKRLDESTGSCDYINYTSRFVQRLVEKARCFTDLSVALSRPELEAFVAALYLRAFAKRGLDPAVAHKILETNGPQGSHLLAVAVEIAALASSPLVPGAMDATQTLFEIRTTFLTALIQLCELLDLDRTALSQPALPQAPGEDAPLDWWFSYLTCEIKIKSPGVVTFRVVAAPNRDAEAETVRRTIALRFNAAWQRLRPYLTLNGIVAASCPVEKVVTATVPVLSASVIKKLDETSEQAAANLGKLDHLGEEDDLIALASRLLPFPVTTVRDDLLFPIEAGGDCSLVLRDPQGNELAQLQSDADGELRLPFATIQSSPAGLIWTLMDNSDDLGLPFALGKVRPLSDAGRFQLDCQNPPSLALKHALGLWNEVIAETWTAVIEGRAAPDEALLVHEAVMAAWNWLYTRSDDTDPRQLEALTAAEEFLRKNYIERKA